MKTRYVVAVQVGPGQWRRVYPRGTGRVVWRRALASAGTFTADQLPGVRAWAKRRGYRLKVHALNPFPMLQLDTDTGWPEHALCAALNRVGRRLGRRLFIREGTRSHARQAALYDQNMNADGTPKPGHPLTARPGTSNHEDHADDADTRGEAADVGVLPNNVNIGEFPGARAAMTVEGLCLPVPGETWHVEQGASWRA